MTELRCRLASATRRVTAPRTRDLGSLVLRALARGTLTGVTAGTGLAALAIATAYGASDELHQRYVPGRTADLQDLRADATGAAGGIAIAWLVAVFVRVRKSRI